ncbi:uncharacterized protein BCR38DRAFT_316078, partial [Pseudomassariella vexata]
MGSKSGIALKLLQWFIRGVQFCCAAVVLALFSYFLATLHNHELSIPTWIRAVEGISGVAVVYTLTGLLLLCCLAGHPFTSFVAIVLDIAFAGAFIYVAIANKGGAGSCKGTVTTPFGTGDANEAPTGSDGFTQLPSYRQACQLETACFAVSLIAIFFFFFSILVEIVLVRHRRKEARFGPSPANNYTSGYGGRKGKFLGLFKRRGTTATENPNALPLHTTPDQVRPSYGTETTAVGPEPTTYNKYGDTGFQH